MATIAPRDDDLPLMAKCGEIQVVMVEDLPCLGLARYLYLDG